MFKKKKNCQKLECQDHDNKIESKDISTWSSSKMLWALHGVQILLPRSSNTKSQITIFSLIENFWPRTSEEWKSDLCPSKPEVERPLTGWKIRSFLIIFCFWNRLNRLNLVENRKGKYPSKMLCQMFFFLVACQFRTKIIKIKIGSKRLPTNCNLDQKSNLKTDFFR